MNPAEELKQKNLKERNALRRVFSSEDGKIVIKKIQEYRQEFFSAALNRQIDSNQQLRFLNEASGVDGVLWLIDDALREEEEKPEKEEK